jgi:hypothetical protein
MVLCPFETNNVKGMKTTEEEKTGCIRLQCHNSQGRSYDTKQTKIVV